MARADDGREHAHRTLGVHCHGRSGLSRRYLAAGAGASHRFARRQGRGAAAWEDCCVRRKRHYWVFRVPVLHGGHVRLRHRRDLCSAVRRRHRRGHALAGAGRCRRRHRLRPQETALAMGRNHPAGQEHHRIERGRRRIPRVYAGTVLTAGEPDRGFCGSLSRSDGRGRMTPVSRTYAAYVVFLLFLANIANYGQRMMVSILLPAIKADVLLSDAQLGILMGGGFALMYAVAGVPLARFADRHGRGRWLAIALVFWSTTTALFGSTRAFSQMLAARIALGIGESLCIPTSHSLLTDYVAPENRAFAFGLHSTGAVVGVTLALILGGYLEASMGWRHAMVLAAVPGILLGLVIGATLREPPRTGVTATHADTNLVPLGEVISHLLSLKSYLWVLMAVCFGMLVEYGLNQWLPTYYVRQFGLSVADVGFRYGLT